MCNFNVFKLYYYIATIKSMEVFTIITIKLRYRRLKNYLALKKHWIISITFVIKNILAKFKRF